MCVGGCDVFFFCVCCEKVDVSVWEVILFCEVCFYYYLVKNVV